jgi:hypothetical protein
VSVCVCVSVCVHDAIDAMWWFGWLGGLIGRSIGHHAPTYTHTHPTHTHPTHTRLILSLSHTRPILTQTHMTHEHTHTAFTYLESSGGLALEEDYPYEAEEGRCKLMVVETVEGTEVGTCVIYVCRCVGGGWGEVVCVRIDYRLLAGDRSCLPSD